MLDTTKTIYIDAREPSEFGQRHLQGALNIPLSSINGTTQIGLPKDTKIVIYCNSGNRSAAAMQKLQALGYTNVENGISQDAISLGQNK